MGVSYSLFSLAKVQEEKGFIEYLDSIKKYGSLNYKNPTITSRYPTIKEVFEVLKQSGIAVKSENKYLDECELKKGNKLTVHSLNITDSEQLYEDDLTFKYPETDNSNVPVISISGIKTNIRILIKFTTELTKICGPYIILSPYEVCLINETVSYEEFKELIKGKLIDDE